MFDLRAGLDNLLRIGGRIGNVDERFNLAAGEPAGFCATTINRDIYRNAVEIGFRTVQRLGLGHAVELEERLLKGFSGEVGRTQPTLQTVEKIPVVGEQDATQ